MPIEIKQIIVKAEVENKKDNTTKPSKENLDYKEVNLEYLIDEIYRKTQKKKERLATKINWERFQN